MECLLQDYKAVAVTSSYLFICRKQTPKSSTNLCCSVTTSFSIYKGVTKIVYKKGAAGSNYLEIKQELFALQGEGPSRLFQFYPVILQVYCIQRCTIQFITTQISHCTSVEQKLLNATVLSTLVSRLFCKTFNVRTLKPRKRANS